MFTRGNFLSKIIIQFIFILLFSSVFADKSEVQRAQPVEMQSFNDNQNIETWEAPGFKPGTFVIEPADSKVNNLKAATTGSQIIIIVESNLLMSIWSSLSQYQADLSNEGYTSSIYFSSGGTKEQLRDTLIGFWNNGMIGALFIGDLPIAWYNLFPSEPDGRLPTDHYYRDLDGIWGDADADDSLDSHTGNTEGDIWLGRLLPSPLTYGNKSEHDLINNYFRKNHDYRTGELSQPNKALLY